MKLLRKCLTIGLLAIGGLIPSGEAKGEEITGKWTKLDPVPRLEEPKPAESSIIDQISANAQEESARYRTDMNMLNGRQLILNEEYIEERHDIAEDVKDIYETVWKSAAVKFLKDNSTFRHVGLSVDSNPSYLRAEKGEIEKMGSNDYADFGISGLSLESNLVGGLTGKVNPVRRSAELEVALPVTDYLSLSARDRLRWKYLPGGRNDIDHMENTTDAGLKISLGKIFSIKNLPDLNIIAYRETGNTTKEGVLASIDILLK